MTRYTREQRSSIYQAYCQTIAANSGLMGEQLRERIRECNRRLYVSLGHSTEVRQRDMSEDDLDEVTSAREASIELMSHSN